MKDFYVKNKDGNFVPVNVNKIFGDDLAGHLVIVRVGTDDLMATSSDLDMTEYVLSKADVLNETNNISVIITPHQIEIETINEEDIGDKSIYLQITKGGDVGMLEEKARALYNKIKGKFKTVILPSPLKVSEYKSIKDILKRSKIRRDRRGRVKG